MDRCKAPGVPTWVSVFAIFMTVTGIVVGVVALVDPSIFPFSDGHLALGRRWAGRNLGLAVVTAGAVALRQSSAYVLALAGGIAREVGDLAAAATEGDSTIPALLFIAIGLSAIVSIQRNAKHAASGRPLATRAD